MPAFNHHYEKENTLSNNQDVLSDSFEEGDLSDHDHFELLPSALTYLEDTSLDFSN